MDEIKQLKRENIELKMQILQLQNTIINYQFAELKHELDSLEIKPTETVAD